MPEVIGLLAQDSQNSLKLFLAFLFLSVAVVISVTWLAQTGSFFLRFFTIVFGFFHVCVFYTPSFDLCLYYFFHKERYSEISLVV